MIAAMKRVLAALVALSACSAEPAGPPPLAPTPAATASLTDLSTSLAALQADFNAHRGETRFLTLLSPT